MPTLYLKTTTRLVALLTVLAFFVACDLTEKVDLPAWDNTIEFAITHEVINLDELLDEDEYPEINKQLWENGDSIFAYSQTVQMDRQDVSDQLLLDDMQQSFSQSVDDVTVEGSQITNANEFETVGVEPISKNIPSQVGTIELDDIPSSTTDPFRLSEIVPSVTDIPDGTETEIESNTLEPIAKPFTFDDFESADFSGGALNITINNSMVIYLGNPITIQLQDAAENDIVGASVTFNSPIPPLTGMATEVMDLTGITLPGDILVKITGSTLGTNGETITVDAAAKNSSFNVEISGSDLEVSQADAKIPSQTIEESGQIELADSENKVQRAELETATLRIDIDNAMGVESDLTINIPSLEDPSGAPYSTTIHLDANSSESSTTNLAGYAMVMDLATQQVDYDYSVITVDSESDSDLSTDFVTINEEDSVVVTIDLYGAAEGEDIVFSSIIGIIKPQRITKADSIDISSDSKILSANIASGEINIAFDNPINQPGFEGLPDIRVQINEIMDSNGDTLVINHELQPGSGPDNQLLVDLASHTLVFPDTANQVLTYTTLVTTPQGEVGSFQLGEEIAVDIVVGDMAFSSVTGYFDQDPIEELGSIELNEGSKLVRAVFREGSIDLNMTNGIGIEAEVEFQLDQFIHRTTQQPLREVFNITSETGVQGPDPIMLSDYDLVFPSAASNEDQEITYSSRITLLSENEMTLSFGQAIDITVDITGLEMQRITGIIEADTLEIAPTEQSVELPELVEDMEFDEVNIRIDFNTGITIPVLLNLELSATSPDGNTVVLPPIQQNITAPDSDVVYIVGAEELLNIHPETITASGYAIVGNSSDTGSVAYGDTVGGMMYIDVPLSLIINDPPAMELDVTALESPLPDDQPVSLQKVTLFADILNEFDFGAEVVVLIAEDSLAFDSVLVANNQAPPSEVWIELEIEPGQNGLDSIALDRVKLDYLTTDQFIQPQVQLLGRADGEPSRFLTTDSLAIRLWGSMTYRIDPEEDE